MTNAITQILSIQVSLEGFDRIAAYLDKINLRFVAWNGTVRDLAKDLSTLGIVLAGLGYGAMQASESQTMLARLEGFVGNVQIATNQMNKINALAEEGVFKREGWGQAVETLDKAGLSLSKNLNILEALGVRMRSITEAARTLEIIQGAAPGPIPRITQQLLQAGITPEMLGEHGVKVVGRTVLSGKDQLMKALREIAENDPVYKKLEDTFGARLQGLMFSAQRLAESFSTPFLGGLTKAVDLLQSAFNWMKDLNAATNGWAGTFLIGGALFEGLRRIWAFIVDIKMQQMMSAVWSAAQAASTWLTAGGLTAALATLKGMTPIQTLQAVLAAAWAAAYGNFVPLAILGGAIALTAGLVYGADKLVDNYRNSREKGMDAGIDKPGSHADNPVRHDDIENLSKRLRGFNWVG